MFIELNSAEQELLRDAKIAFNPGHALSEEEAFAMLDLVYEQEICYAQDAETNANSSVMAERYAHLADKIQAQIPE